MVDVLVSGHICLDLLPSMGGVTSDDLVIPGRLYEVGPLAISGGGAVANTGIALHKLGIDVGLEGKVGDDLTGRIIVAWLRDHRHELGDLIKIQSGQSSSYSVVLSPQNTDRTFLHCTGTNDTFGVDDVDFQEVAHARIYHLGYPPLLPRLYSEQGRELVAIFQQAKANGVITSLDMAMPDPAKASGKVDWRPILSEVLPYVDIFVPSIEEIVMMLHGDDFQAWGGDVLPHLTMRYLEKLTDELLAMGCAVTGFKLSHLGMYIRTTGDIEHIQALASLPVNVNDWQGVALYQPAYQVDVVGTTGAGDSAYAALLASLIHGKSPQDAIQIACAVAASSAEASSATAGIQGWENTLRRLAAGWELRPERVPSA